MKFILPILLVSSLLLCSCSVDSLGDIISSITGNTEKPDNTTGDEKPDVEKPNTENPDSEQPSDTPNDDPTD